MNLSQTLVAFVQQMRAAGLRIVERPMLVEGAASEARRFRCVMQYLREKAADRKPQVDIDEQLSRMLDAEGVILWPALGLRSWTWREEDILPHLGSMVWTGERVFIYGRLEGVMPGIALITPRPDPVLPSDAVAAFRARTEKAFPFSVDLVESGAKALHGADLVAAP